MITSTASEGDWWLSTHADSTSTRCTLGFWGAEFPKMGDSLPIMPMKLHAKFDAASFFLAAEICNLTNRQKTTNKNSKRYIHMSPIGIDLYGTIRS